MFVMNEMNLPEHWEIVTELVVLDLENLTFSVKRATSPYLVSI